MKLRALAAVTVGLLLFAGVGAVQAAASNPAYLKQQLARAQRARQLLDKVLKERGINSRQMTLSGGATAYAVCPNGEDCPPGWSPWFYANNCGWFEDSYGNQDFYIYPNLGGLIIELNSPDVARGLMVPCSNGNLFTVYVYDYYGDFDQTYSTP